MPPARTLPRRRNDNVLIIGVTKDYGSSCRRRREWMGRRSLRRKSTTPGPDGAARPESLGPGKTACIKSWCSWPQVVVQTKYPRFFQRAHAPIPVRHEGRGKQAVPVERRGVHAFVARMLSSDSGQAIGCATPSVGRTDTSARRCSCSSCAAAVPNDEQSPASGLHRRNQRLVDDVTAPSALADHRRGRRCAAPKLGRSVSSWRSYVLLDARVLV
jgi:hypothetical protein